MDIFNDLRNPLTSKDDADLRARLRKEPTWKLEALAIRLNEVIYERGRSLMALQPPNWQFLKSPEEVEYYADRTE